MADTHYEDDQSSTAASAGDLASIARRVATCRYQAFVADMGTPVNITRSRPRWKLPYELTVRIGELAPTASEFILESEAFDDAYRARLEALGADAVLGWVAEAVPEGRAVLLCYEDLWKSGRFTPELCHRRTLAQWLTEKTGVEIPELTRPDASLLSDGGTTDSDKTAADSPVAEWTEETFIEEMSRRGHSSAGVVRRLLDWAILRADINIAGNTTRPEPSLRLTPMGRPAMTPLLTIWMTTVEVRPARNASAGLEAPQLLTRLHELFGVQTSKDGRYTFVPLTSLEGPRTRHFLRLMNDLLGPPIHASAR